MRILLLVYLTAFSIPAMAAGAKEPMYMQVLLGELKLDDSTVSITHADQEYLGEIDDLPYLGAAAQVILDEGLIGYGWEGGAFLSWINKDIDYYAWSGVNGTTVRISAENAFWSFETFMGLYADFKPVDRLRFYLSGGPLILIASAKIQDAEEQPAPMNYNANIVITNDDSRDTDISTGLYARAGIELRLTHQTWVGLNVRHIKTDADLSRSLGEFDIDGDLYLLSVTNRY